VRAGRLRQRRQALVEALGIDLVPADVPDGRIGIVGHVYCAIGHRPPAGQGVQAIEALQDDATDEPAHEKATSMPLEWE